MEDICVTLFIIIVLCISIHVFKKFIFPVMVKIDTREIEKNPKWIIEEARKNYYGFQDIDIILAETNLFYSLPRFRFSKENRFELLVPNDVSTKDVDKILHLAIMGKIQVKYGLVYHDKPLHWLSILCYMLDGGEIRETAAKFEEK